MAYLIRCNGCGKKYSVGDHRAGAELPCKSCGTSIQVPQRSASLSIAWQSGIMAAAVLLVAVIGFFAGRASLGTSGPTVTAMGSSSDVQDLSIPRSTGSRQPSANSPAGVPQPSNAVLNQPATSDDSISTSRPATGPGNFEIDVLGENDIDRGVNWGDDDPDWSIPCDSKMNVAFSPFPARFALVENELFDLTNGTITATLPSSVSRGVRVISPDGTKVAMHPKGSPRVPEIRVYTTQHPDAAPVVLPNYTSEERMDMMYFLDENNLIGYSGLGRESKYFVWNTTTGKELRSFKGENPARAAWCLSPHGKYLAVAHNEDVIVYDVEQGRELARMFNKWNAKTLPIMICDGLAFSPDGKELAGSFFGGSQIAVWTVKGELKLFATIPNCVLFRADDHNGLNWLPDGSGWLFGGTNLVRRDNLLLTWQLGADERSMTHDRISSMVDQHHVVTTRQSGNGYSVAVIQVPWKQIGDAIDVLGPQSAPLVYHDGSVGLKVAVETRNASDQQTVSDEISFLLRKRLESNRVIVAEKRPVMLTFDYQEKTGKELQLRTSDGSEKRIPTVDISTSVTWTHQGETLWSHSFKPIATRGLYLRSPDEKSLRDQAYREVIDHYSDLAIPTRICGSAKFRLPLQTGLRDRRGEAQPWKWTPEPTFEDFTSPLPETDSVRSQTSVPNAIPAPPVNPPIASASAVSSKPETPMRPDQRFDIARIPVPEFPELGSEVHRFESGQTVHFVRLNHEPVGAGTSMTMRIYLPSGPQSPRSIGCVLIAPAGTNLLVGNDVDAGDYHAEALPYAEAGMAVVFYSLDGSFKSDLATNESLAAAYKQFKAACAGVVNGRNAVEFVLKKLPQVDPKRIFSAGHSSAATVSLLLAAHEPRIAGCIAYAPASDVPSRLQKLLDMRSSDTLLLGIREFVVQSSPKTHVAYYQCPLFVFHAYDDTNEPHHRTADFVDHLLVAKRNVLFVSADKGDHYQSMIQEGIPGAIVWLQKLQGIEPVTKQAVPESDAMREDAPSRKSESPEGTIPDGTRIVIMEIASYSGKGDMIEEVRKALRVAPWAVASTAYIDTEKNEIVMAVTGNSIDTGPLKAALETAGFMFGFTKLRTK